MIRFALIGLLSLATPVMAQQTPGLATLPPEVAERILSRPDRFADMAADMIHGHGTGGAVTLADLDRAIALDRAYYRARALRPFHESDLNGDGTLDRTETAARAASLGTTARARLMRQHDSVDLDGDDSLSPQELRAHAEAEVIRTLPLQEEQMIRAILAFDANADGGVTLAEIDSAIAALPQPG